MWTMSGANRYMLDVWEKSAAYNHMGHASYGFDCVEGDLTSKGILLEQYSILDFD